MILREIVEALIDADVECGARTEVCVAVDGHPPFTVRAIDIDEFGGPTVWIRAEKM